MATGYLVVEKSWISGQICSKEKNINTAYNILHSFDFI